MTPDSPPVMSLEDQHKGGFFKAGIEHCAENDMLSTSDAAYAIGRIKYRLNRELHNPAVVQAAYDNAKRNTPPSKSNCTTIAIAVKGWQQEEESQHKASQIYLQQQMLQAQKEQQEQMEWDRSMERLRNSTQQLIQQSQTPMVMPTFGNSLGGGFLGNKNQTNCVTTGDVTSCRNSDGSKFNCYTSGNNTVCK